MQMLSESDIVRTLLQDRIKILAYLDSFLGDYQLAEDCFQDVCAAAVDKQDYFNDENHVLRWALRAGRNKSIDLVRRRSRERQILDEKILDQLEDQWFSQSTYPADEDSVRVEALRECLAALTANSRRIVHLRYSDGLKPARIAELLERKVASVYRALTRAHVALRECMERRLNDDMKEEQI